ncbi:Protein ASI1 [Spathaspora sp. JA1]|nr:Protein ASI1 [Spathaspora sp. JA1]
MDTNTTGIINNASNTTTSDDYFVVVKFITSFIDAIWEQSETSAINSLPWNRLGAISTYCCSIYGLSCLIMALILNRTLVLASINTSYTQQLAINRTRMGILDNYKQSAAVLKSITIVCFRLAVILSLCYNGYNVLVSLNLINHIGDPDLGWIYSMVLPDKYFAYSSEYYGSSRYMSTPESQVMIGPTSDMYWPIFLNFCWSSFTETLIAAIQGKKPYTETGITIFEHSLAFQEFSSNGAFFFSNSKYHKRPTEQVLLATLFSIVNHLNIQLGGLVNNNKYRLIPSTMFGMTFLSYFIYTFKNWKILQFPFILILTFTPQVLILGIIAISFTIFMIAIVINGFELKGLNYASFFLHELNEEQEEEESLNLNINLNDDFYTALLNIGILAITSAGKSSYISELSLITVDKDTWVERSLWQQLTRTRARVQSKDIVQYLREHDISGYANLISQPSSRLITEDIDMGTTEPSSSVWRRRVDYMKVMIVNTWQLSCRLIIDGFGKLFRKDHEVRKIPQFLQKYVVTRTRGSTVNIDSIPEEQLNSQLLISQEELSEIDNSGDYKPEEVSDSEYESEDEVDEEIEEIPRETSIYDLFTFEEFNEIMSSPNSILMLQQHMQYSGHGPLTRSHYHTTTIGPPDDTNKLIELIIAKRNNSSNNDLISRLECVICQTNIREIITWPCKCFAICDGCRLSLVSKGIEGCVCCRREVEGVSKVFIP